MLIAILKIKDNKSFYKEITGEDIIKTTLPIAIMTTSILNGNIAFAVDKPSAAFKPIIETLQDLAEPVSYGFMIKGFLQVVAGEGEKGKKTIKDAIAGYIGIQWMPWIFGLVKSIGK